MLRVAKLHLKDGKANRFYHIDRFFLENALFSRIFLIFVIVCKI